MEIEYVAKHEVLLTVDNQKIIAGNDNLSLIDVAVLEDDIFSLPAADVRPVVRGHYVGEYDGYADGNPVYDMWYCSECGCYFEDWDEKPTYNFCPNCGADMREPNLDTTKGDNHD